MTRSHHDRLADILKACRRLGYATDCQPSIYQKACMGRGVTVTHIYSRELKQHARIADCTGSAAHRVAT